MTDRHSHFQPKLPVAEGRPNSRTLVRIERDGTSISLVRLHVIDQRDREKIILLHFLRQYLPRTYRRDCGVNIISRDAPWDFVLEIDDGSTFNVEITSVAENESLFKLESAERELSSAKVNKHLSLRKLQKLDELYPDDKRDTSSGTGNPYFEEQVVTVSSLPPAVRPYRALLEEAISSKSNKVHGGKAETILVIDDQTSAFTRDEIFSSLGGLESRNPFKEIWIYIGYWGTISGEGEYSLIKFQPVA